MGSEPTFDVIEFEPAVSLPSLRRFASRELLSLPDPSRKESSCACVLRETDLEELFRIVPSGLILDRGRKHPSKRLSDYLAGRGGLLAIRTGYKEAGRASRGVRVLLEAAARSKAVAVFFIGVPDAVFDALRDRAALTPRPADKPPGSVWGLGGLLGDGCGIEVPASLRTDYVGESEPVEWVRRAIVLASRMDRRHVVLVQGESGTGKEIVARQIHDLSGCCAESFIAVNCGGIPTELLESELFGHLRGSFTGALRNKSGLWELADRGTLFLDEIGDLSPAHQVKVLRALNEREFTPIGGAKPIKSNARVIAASNRDLGLMVRAGTFREDLFYRLFTFRIRTPALRDHPRDIPVISRYIWSKYDLPGILTDAVTAGLSQFRWPGNVRELRAFLVNLAVVANGRRVDIRLVNAVMRDRMGPIAGDGDQ